MTAIKHENAAPPRAIRRGDHRGDHGTPRSVSCLGPVSSCLAQPEHPPLGWTPPLTFGPIRGLTEKWNREEEL